MEISQITIAPDPYAPFRVSQGHRVGDFDAQAEQVFANLRKVLAVDCPA